MRFFNGNSIDRWNYEPDREFVRQGWYICDNGHHTMDADVVCISRATMWEPAEYVAYCEICGCETSENINNLPQRCRVRKRRVVRV